MMFYDEEMQDIQFEDLKVGDYEIIIDLVDEFFQRNRYEIDVTVYNSTFIPPPEIKYQEKERVVTNWEPEYLDLDYTLKAKIDSIDYIGNIVIEFSEIVKEAEIYDPSFINETVLDIKVIPHEVTQKTNMSQFDLKWEATDFIREKQPIKGRSKLLIKLRFSDPLYISQNLIQDTLQVRFLNITNFTSEASNLPLDPEYVVINKSLKPQMPNTAETMEFMNSSDNVDLVLKISFIIALILNFLLSSESTMDYYVGMIQTLQIIAHFPLLRILMPANVSFFLSMLLPLVMFDILDIVEDTIYDPTLLFTFAEDKNELDTNLFTDQMVDLGYETHNSILNTRTLFFTIMFYFIRVVFVVGAYLYYKLTR